MDKVGFIGLGTMGLPMARNLARHGVALNVWNRTQKAPDVFPDGCDVAFARSPRAVLRGSRTSILILLNQDAVDAVLERDTAAFAENVGGKTIIGMGSVDPSYSVALADDIAQVGGAYLEAPVSGSRVPAENGQLVCLLGGDRAVAEAAAPLLRPMCKDQIHCGSAGDALRMKLAINLYLCSSLVALAEATNFARKAGLPLDKFTQAVEAGPLSSDFVTIKLPKMIEGDFAVQAGVADAHMSTCLIRTEAARLCLATPQLDVSSDLYARAVKALGPKVDMSSVISVLN
ncbi:NAD(P)-dependent oxidoreductase [Marivita sp.]|uniref:NAD(P)-dependent oxidoreductase n=1 Tax=Marivita sp. TaxID=2003365 RepID=UPI00260C4787|nr:NAD(P)-dependent oxidoreductase [Marivita sp.]